MFCIQRKLRARDEHPDWPNWLAWADYLIIATIMISVLLVILRFPSRDGSYYRIELGIWRQRKAKARKPATTASLWSAS